MIPARALRVLAMALLGTSLGPVSSASSPASDHPLAPGNCALPKIDGDAAWQAFRRSAGLVSWPDDLPSRSDPAGVRASGDGRLLLLAGPRTLALFHAPAVARRSGALMGITHRDYGGDFIRPEPDRPVSLAWAICMGSRKTDPETCKPDGKLLQSAGYRGTWREETVDGVRGLTMTWTGIDEDVVVQTHHQIHDDAVRTRIDARDLGKNERGIVSLRFPMLPGGGRSLDDKVQLIIPRFNIGLVCEDCGAPAEYYPSLFLSMPWFGYLSGEVALYVGAHDPTGGVKRIKTSARGGHLGHAYFERYPESSGSAGNTISSSWWTVLEPLCADRGWPVVTFPYRRWVTRNTPWGRAPPLAERAEPPRDLRESAWWVNQSIPQDASIGRLRDRAGRITPGIRQGIVAFHWYNWHLPGMDLGFPSFVPKPGTAQLIKELQADGHYVFPYTNAAHTDQSTAPIATGRPKRCVDAHSHYPNLFAGALIRPDGTRHFAKTSSGACLVRMNPLHHEWRETVRENTRSVAQDLGARGVYLDAVGGAFRGSWDSDGHSPGLGAWVMESTRSLVEHAKPSGTVIALEGALEQLIGIGAVGLNYLKTRRDMAPLFMVVHHERALIAGLRSLRPEDHVALAIKNGLATAWGMQPGLSNLQLRRPEGPSNLVWVNTLMRARQLLKEWLVYGEFMGPLLVGSAEKATSVHSKRWCDDVKKCDPAPYSRPAVEAVLYRSLSGVDRVILFNMAEAEAIHSAVLPPHLRDRSAVIYTLEGEEIGRRKPHQHGDELVLRVPARSVYYVAFEAADG